MASLRRELDGPAVGHGGDDGTGENASGWPSVSSADRDHEGWLHPGYAPVWVEVPDAAVPGRTTKLGLRVVVDDAGEPVGYLGPQGFVRGSMTPSGDLTPEARARFRADRGPHVTRR